MRLHVQMGLRKLGDAVVISVFMHDSNRREFYWSPV